MWFVGKIFELEESDQNALTKKITDFQTISM